jgi:hypothetical protein
MKQRVEDLPDVARRAVRHTGQRLSRDLTQAKGQRNERMEHSDRD